MHDFVDDETREIIARYIREVREGKIRAEMFNTTYDSEGMLDRLIALKAIG